MNPELLCCQVYDREVVVMQPQIRPAVEEDKDPMARLLHIAALGHLKTCPWDRLFAGTMQERLEKLGWLFLKGKNLLMHYSRIKVAEVDGEVAACLSMYREEDTTMSAWVRTLLDMGLRLYELPSVWLRLYSWLRVYPSMPKDIMIVGTVAAFPEFRRRGLVQSLLREAIEQGRREGYSQIQIATLIGNTPALRAYEKAGFNVVDASTYRPFQRSYGSPGYLRLALQIQSNKKAIRHKGREVMSKILLKFL